MVTVNDLLKREHVTDEEILDCDYGLANFTFNRIPSPIETIRLRKMRSRLGELEAIRKAARQARTANRQVRMELADCGHHTTEKMNASHGSSCPDCYDRMSDE